MTTAPTAPRPRPDRAPGAVANTAPTAPTAPIYKARGAVGGARSHQTTPRPSDTRGPTRPRETAEAKGMRYLVEHRLTIVEVNADRVRAVARGGGEVYDLGLDGSDWWCTCECRTRACSHLHALRAVVTRRRTDG